MRRLCLAAALLVAIGVGLADVNANSALPHFPIDTTADTTPPTIQAVEVRTFPSSTGGLANISAEVSDDVAVDTVFVRIAGSSLDTNVTMVRGTGGTWYSNRSYDQLGTYSYTIWAVDSSGNARSVTGSFTLGEATTAPPAFVALIASILLAAAALAVIWFAFRARRRGPPKPPPHRI